VRVTLFTFNDLPYRVILFADVFAFVWMMGMMYTTKFLDGLDGLVSGVTTIGAIVLFVLSLTREVAQPETALLAVILAGAAAGFLIFNFHPAKIFLGEGGSLWMGFILGTLAIISGAKIATALLILGIPILDVAWVIMRRLLQGKSVTHADRQHLHFRLLDIGLSHRAVVFILYAVTAAFGISALLFHGKEKLIVLFLLLVVMLVIASIVVRKYKKKGDS
ncbi:MAG: MraY family glycosyltransferase, partial [Patescibacteria group bacterium]|jgi:UDP-N-acetylmuramyl pentapeptide phosphotransferase/UDP-N-acetylglucosamine-1-phosphate transferase